jgi:hypothetical protein
MGPLGWLRRPVGGIPLWRFVLRVAWVAVQVILAVWLGQQGQLFFYEGF